MDPFGYQEPQRTRHPPGGGMHPCGSKCRLQLQNPSPPPGGAPLDRRRGSRGHNRSGGTPLHPGAVCPHHADHRAAPYMDAGSAACLQSIRGPRRRRRPEARVVEIVRKECPGFEHVLRCRSTGHVRVPCLERLQDPLVSHCRDLDPLR